MIRHKYQNTPLTFLNEMCIRDRYYIDHIRKIIKSPMLDLSEYSNTDLKLAYGVGNFKVLCEYDENFNHFLLALTNLAQMCIRDRETVSPSPLILNGKRI